MRSTHVPGPALVLLAALATPALAAWPNQPAVNLPVCTAPSGQGTPVIVSDDAGGAIVAWYDSRSGASDIYAQHLLASGSVDPAWPANGRAICTAILSQLSPAIVPDGSGGAIIAWSDSRGGLTFDIYAQHVRATGVVDPAWPANGRAICTAADNQLSTVLVPDGTGGAILSWEDRRSGTYHIYAHHVLASGAVDPVWPADGRAICTATGGQDNHAAVADGAGGAIMTWGDLRSGTWHIYAHRVLASGAVDPAWPVDGRLVCNAAGGEDYPALAADGTGGAFLVWTDYRVDIDLYAAHVFGTGLVDPTWPTDGKALCVASGLQTSPRVVSDGAGGAIAAWSDSRTGDWDIYAQRVRSNGSIAPGWAADGQLVCAASLEQSHPVIATDGAGGALVAWDDVRAGGYTDAYAQHMLGSGAADPSWPADGQALSTAANAQYSCQMASDGAGAAIVTWQDDRGANGSDVYAQRVARYGWLGTPEAEITGVKDVLNDQGGKVKVSWNASYLEADPLDYYLNYYLFRSVPSSLAQSRLARGARLATVAESAPAPGDLVAAPSSAGIIYWELVTTLGNLNVPGYSYVASTTGDSIAGSNPLTQFMVQVRWGGFYATEIWNSAPGSGYSVDNLPPVAPAPFTGQYAGGTANLHWNPNTELDLAGYRLYRGTSLAFVPGPGNLVGELPDTGYVDAAGSPYIYKLIAVDSHGNESPVATLLPSGVLDVEGGGAVRSLSFAAPSPNPARSTVTLRCALPAAAPARLAIYDAAGRLVRTIASGTLGAGEHSIAWDLRSAAGGQVGAGLYFARFEAGGHSFTRRMVVAR